MRKLFNQNGLVHILPLFIIIAAVGIISYLLISSTAPLNGIFGTINSRPASQAATSSNGCGLTNPAFCETFDGPVGPGIGGSVKSGDLNGIVWGVSREAGGNPNGNVYGWWEGTQMDYCGENINVLVPNDVRICNGQLMEAANDAGGTFGLAIYPKQPFDFAGRTGIVTFDMSNDTKGTHQAWPQFALTDKPIPVPHPTFVDPTNWDLPQNAVGVSFAARCQNCQGPNLPPDGPNPDGTTFNCITPDAIWMTKNGVYTRYGIYGPPPFKTLGCVHGGPAGHNNHVRIEFTSTSVKVFESDADQPDLREVAEVTDVQLPLTRGLIWLEHASYNACKEGFLVEPTCQQQHTFSWDNVGFDGPILPRDLTFDVPDNNKPNGTSFVNNTPPQPSLVLGYVTQQQAVSSITLPIPNVSSVEKAAAALLVMNVLPVDESQPQGTGSATLNYSLNGHTAHTWPISSKTVSDTLALPVPLNEVTDGNNSLTLSAPGVSSSGVNTGYNNISLILVGAGGMPCSINPSLDCNGLPLPTPTPCITCTPPPTPAPIPTQPPPTPVPTTCPTCSASFVGQDNSTQGFWKGVYGKDGSWIENDSQLLPGYAQTSVLKSASFTWLTSTADVRALQKASSSTDRIAATWFGNSFTIDVNPTDGLSHKVSLYGVDWDNGARAETISVTDASGIVLDTRSISNFTNGTYLSWNIKGHVQFNVNSTGSSNGVVSAIFFDPTSAILTPQPSACPKTSLGDINCDGVINIFDYNLEIANFGKTCTLSQGDLDGNSICNIFDYNILVGNFGK